MKKYVFIVLFAGIMASCGTSKIERQAQRTLKGEWTLTAIELPSALVDVNLFEDEDSKCFENSNWKFVPNNNTGTYELMQQDCEEGERNFHWTIKEDSENEKYYLTFKPEIEGTKARKVKSGYKIEILSLDDAQMVWEQVIDYEGKPFTIQMNFSKN